MVNVKNLKKGDLLIREGDNSNSIYWVQSGTLRLFKRKGAGFIELGVVHSGEVVGEMSFLDNQPRSASVEALQPSDVVEIPRGKFDEFIATQPSWMKSLIMVMVKRLRTTNNRLKEIENSSMVYAKENGRTVKVHEFLPAGEILRLCSGLFLVSLRSGEKTPEGHTKIKAGWFQLFGAQIFGVQLSKVQVFTDIMQDAGFLKIDKQKDHVDLIIHDVDTLERFIFWLNDENTKLEENKMQMNEKGVNILNAIVKYTNITSLPKETEVFPCNMDKVGKDAAVAEGKKIAIELSSFEQLVKLGFGTEIRAQPDGLMSEIQVKKFLKYYPLLALREKFREVNAQKRGEEN